MSQSAQRLRRKPLSRHELQETPEEVYFTVHQKEWEGMTPEGQEAMAKMAELAMKHFSGNRVDGSEPR